MPADTSPLYSHRRDDPERESDCRCGALSVRDPRVGESWGRNCPAAMREEIARLRAELAEALATLDNERGEGEPPDPSFKWRAGRWVSDTLGVQIVLGERGWHVEDLWYDAHVQHSEPAYSSARVAMTAAKEPTDAR